MRPQKIPSFFAILTISGHIWSSNNAGQFTNHVFSIVIHSYFYILKNYFLQKSFLGLFFIKCSRPQKFRIFLQFWPFLGIYGHLILLGRSQIMFFSINIFIFKKITFLHKLFFFIKCSRAQKIQSFLQFWQFWPFLGIYVPNFNLNEKAWYASLRP